MEEKKRVCLEYNGKNLFLEVKECKGINKFIGLMFSRSENADALLFDFVKSRRWAIHSLFCPEFVAIWLDSEGKVVEIKKVKPWRFSVKPKKYFVKLIEIPINVNYSKITKSLVGNL